MNWMPIMPHWIGDLLIVFMLLSMLVFCIICKLMIKKE